MVNLELQNVCEVYSNFKLTNIFMIDSEFSLTKYLYSL